MPHVTSQRERDSAVILNVIRNLGPVSRVEIHHLTRLRTSTISQLTKALLQEGKLATAGLSDNPTGRKQILLKINEEQGFLLAIEFDSEFVTVACTDLAPKIRSIVREQTVRHEGIDGLVAQLKHCSR